MKLSHLRRERRSTTRHYPPAGTTPSDSLGRQSDDGLELIYLTLEDALELYTAIIDDTTDKRSRCFAPAPRSKERSRGRRATRTTGTLSSPCRRRCSHGIAESQAFLDGNKGLALVVMLTFLEANGYRVEATRTELAGWIIDLSASPKASSVS